MPTQTVYMNWGTYINEADQTYPRSGESVIRVGLRSGGYKSRGLFGFNNDGFSGQILSATFNFYCSYSGGQPNFRLFRVNRASNVNATWQSSGLSVWYTSGCDGVNEDRSGISMISDYRIGNTGWHTISIANVSELLEVVNGQDTMLLREVETDKEWATIEKSPLPYLAIEYKTSLIGGIQII